MDAAGQASGYDPFHYLSRHHPRQPFVQPLMVVHQAEVIHPQQMQHRRMEIMDTDRFSTALKPTSSVAP